MSETEVDKKFMARALWLARLGMPHVAPNPMVGCLIEKEGRILAEGWHRMYGQAHAEVEAVRRLADPELVRGATVYVSLEPCSHFGKTPPCADLLCGLQPARVVVASADPNPLVAGRGLEKLRAAGIQVTTGVLEAHSEWLNRRFFTFMRQERPYIVLKWAQTQDGFIARSDYSSKWISSPLSRRLVHKWRAEEQAILVGGRTAVTDNPRLDVRDWPPVRQPLRVVVDTHGSLPEGLHIAEGPQETFLFRPQQPLPDCLPQLLRALHSRKVLSVLVEGGAGVLGAFIGAGLWDEARIFTGPAHFGEGIAAPRLQGLALPAERIGPDHLQVLLNTRNLSPLLAQGPPTGMAF